MDSFASKNLRFTRMHMMMIVATSALCVEINLATFSLHF